ncbi:MAG: LD-carboxypeptidase [Nodosilinea sp. LVE1205-7]
MGTDRHQNDSQPLAEGPADSDIRPTYPRWLQPGDRLYVVAPSGALREPESLHQGIARWRNWGFEVVVPPNLDRRWGYLAGTDEQRRNQLTEALIARDCRGILCARGGYGGTRLLENWVWPESLNLPWVIGFSDITSLLWSLMRQRRTIGVHGPLLTTLGLEPDWAQQRLLDLVTGQPLAPLQGLGWGGGRVTAPLLPANLTVATHLLGTTHQPHLAGVILALEDVTEAPYRIDRLLTHWRLGGHLQSVAGIALGRFSRCDPPQEGASFTVAAVLRDRLTDLGIPIVSALPFGHDGENAALPVGAMACLDGDQGSLTLMPTNTDIKT